MLPQQKKRFSKVLESVCAALGREDGAGAEGGAEGLRAMAAVLLRTLFDVRSDVWFRVQERTRKGGELRSVFRVCSTGVFMYIRHVVVVFSC